MGASGKWIKAFIGLKKPDKDSHGKEEGGGGKSNKKWMKLWRSSSGDVASWKGYKGSHGRGSRAASEEGSHYADDAFTAAVATVVRAPPKDFRLVKEEWAATRIQTTFRAFLV